MYKVGIIGGGQLGKMMILDGKRLDTQFYILDPTERCPADSIADGHIVADFNDIDAIIKMADGVDVVTNEFEHISVPALKKLEGMGYKVYPSSETLRLIQNKLTQKQWLKKHDIPVPEFLPVGSVEELYEAGEKFGYPMMLKTCTGGYDGKGNAQVGSKEEVQAAYESLGAGKLPLMVEHWIDFEKEVSILACRSANGEMAVFPVAENRHKNSILDETTVPAAISDASAKEAMEVARTTLAAFDVVGMLCIELFVTNQGHILVNELAPRPHNSGHYTIEACYTSQYENHVRAILGLPLGNPDLIGPVAMKNIIGDRNGTAELTGLQEAYSLPNVKVHIYGKEQVKKGRKMGHITAMGKTVEEALASVRKAHEVIGI